MFGKRWWVALLTVAITVGCGDDDGGVTPLPDAGGHVDDAGGGPIDAGGIDAGSTDASSPDASSPDAGPPCIDEDGDGYGESCALGPDCDDTNNAISPAAAETCNGVDDDCNGMVDDDVTTPACPLTLGVCAGARQRCGSSGLVACDASDYGSEYEEVESLCDGLDNDCDGSVDEGCTCTEGATQPCGSDVGVCRPGTQTCTAAGTWGACEGGVPAGAETCDGLDNDCDGTVDEDLAASAPACARQQGVCAGSRRTCGGTAGWLECDGTASYGSSYQADETACDGVDNDCDGTIDEGCTCVDGATQACGSTVGACMAGTQTCTAGVWGACTGQVSPTAETCNGVDDDCNGTVDDGIVGPACPLTEGVCAGARQVCSGGSLQACTAASYGPQYQATETRCDGLDNDCDGVVDEGCTCVDGATQACGSAVGECRRGTQTCTGGTWGPCEGGVGPTAETCNGRDDDCNGIADDGLVAPACALTEGVCTDAVQTCGGTAGWLACTAADYGPRYVAVESGETDEVLCDGLDNDCDGTVDEDCTSVPVVATAVDEISPDLYHRHLVYLANFDGNWDVVLANLETGAERRLTATAANESTPRVYGNHVVFVRGEDAAAQVVLYDLRTSTETVLSTGPAGGATIYGSVVLWHQLVDGSHYGVFYYDVLEGAGGVLIDVAGTNEHSPAMRGAFIAFVTDVSGVPLTYLVDLRTGTPVAQMPAATSVNGQIGPMMDYSQIAWTDGRAISSSSASVNDNWNIYGAPFATVAGFPGFPGETLVTNAPQAQLLNDVEGGYLLWSDASSGNWNPVIGWLGGTPIPLSTHSSAQFDPVMSGDVVLWVDNRLGDFDIFGTLVLVGEQPEPGDLVINEILADPPATADVNGDGTASTTQDEFVEIYNVTAWPLDLSGVELHDASQLRHRFPPGTVLPPLGAIVVFGGGSIGPNTLFGGAQTQVASTGQLALNNDSDTVTLRRGTTVLATASYSGTLASADQSIVRSDELDDTSPFVRHSTVPGAIGAYSPGTSADGFAF